MSEPNFRPKSFGTFLDTVRLPDTSQFTPSPAQTETPRISVLRAFGGQQAIKTDDLQSASSLTQGVFEEALKELLDREMVSQSGNIVTLTAKGKDTISLIS